MPAIEDDLPRDLGNGLFLRRSTWADVEALVEFNQWIHRDDPTVPEPDLGVAIWTRELLSGKHPTFGEGDFTIVVEKDTGRIISCLNLISQTWSYGGIPFGVGRVELVATATEYRKRGLIRTQFDVVHQWSKARGELLQAITGIPYYYRQFGYEMALALGGGRICPRGSIPTLKEGQPEPFVLRLPVEADLPFVMELDVQMARQSLLTCVRDERLWHFELFERLPGNVNRIEWRVLQTVTGERAGLVGFHTVPWGERIVVPWVELAPGWSYVQTAASVLRGLKAEGEAVMSQKGKTLDGLYFNFGESHPFYEANHSRLAVARQPYAWYIRVADLPGFLRHIRPALEARLAASWAAGHTGELKLSFYRSGLRLALERGRLTAVEPWQPVPQDNEGDAALPGLDVPADVVWVSRPGRTAFRLPGCLDGQRRGPRPADCALPARSGAASSGWYRGQTPGFFKTPGVCDFDRRGGHPDGSADTTWRAAVHLRSLRAGLCRAPPVPRRHRLLGEEEARCARIHQCRHWRRSHVAALRAGRHRVRAQAPRHGLPEGRFPRDLPAHAHRAHLPRIRLLQDRRHLHAARPAPEGS